MLDLKLLPFPDPSALLGFCGTGTGAGLVPVGRTGLHAGGRGLPRKW